MDIINSIDTYRELRELLWCTEEILNLVEKYHLENEFFDYINSSFCEYEDTPTIAMINDFIRFDVDVENWIAETLSFDNVDDLYELENIAKNLCASEAIDIIREATMEDMEYPLFKYLQDNCTTVQDAFDVLETVDFSELN